MSEFFINFFSPGPWPIQQPLEAAISTSATLTGHQILAEYVSFYSRYCLLVWHENEVGLDYRKVASTNASRFVARLVYIHIQNDDFLIKSSSRL